MHGQGCEAGIHCPVAMDRAGEGQDWLRLDPGLTTVEGSGQLEREVVLLIRVDSRASYLLPETRKTDRRSRSYNIPFAVLENGADCKAKTSTRACRLQSPVDLHM